MAERQPEDGGNRAFVSRTLTVLALIALFLLAWHLRTLLVLGFGAVLVAIILSTIAGPLRRLTRVGETASIVLTVTIIAGLVWFAVRLTGAQLAVQVDSLANAVTQAWQLVENLLRESSLGNQLRDALNGSLPDNGEVLSGISGFLMSMGSGLADFLLVVVGGIYLASQPGFYRKGALKLVPPGRRELVGQALEESGRALQMWLKGQFFSMAVVGLLVWFGLWLLGVPSAIALALLAAALEFIPLLGPIAAALPALLIAFSDDPQSALWVLLLYTGVQQIEGYLLQPLVQKYAVDLPPVILLFSLLAFGMLFGLAGVILAAPLCVVAYVLVKRLYIREALDTPTPVPGELNVDHAGKEP